MDGPDCKFHYFDVIHSPRAVGARNNGRPYRFADGGFVLRTVSIRDVRDVKRLYLSGMSSLSLLWAQIHSSGPVEACAEASGADQAFSTRLLS